jgi:hypothetical protein
LKKCQSQKFRLFQIFQAWTDVDLRKNAQKPEIPGIGLQGPEQKAT